MGDKMAKATKPRQARLAWQILIYRKVKRRRSRKM
jgi:hypothetical protein